LLEVGPIVLVGFVAGRQVELEPVVLVLFKEAVLGNVVGQVLWVQTTSTTQHSSEFRYAATMHGVAAEKKSECLVEKDRREVGEGPRGVGDIVAASTKRKQRNVSALAEIPHRADAVPQTSAGVR
jgi:hypothetical protein